MRPEISRAPTTDCRAPWRPLARLPRSENVSGRGHDARPTGRIWQRYSAGTCARWFQALRATSRITNCEQSLRRPSWPTVPDRSFRHHHSISARVRPDPILGAFTITVSSRFRPSMHTCLAGPGWGQSLACQEQVPPASAHVGSVSLGAALLRGRRRTFRRDSSKRLEGRDSCYPPWPMAPEPKVVIATSALNCDNDRLLMSK